MIKGGIFKGERNLMMLGKDGYGFGRSTFSEVFMKPEVRFILYWIIHEIMQPRTMLTPHWL